MSRDFPDWINPWAAAQGRRRFGGTVPLARMKRLARLVESTDGEAAFEARFALDEDRRPVIDLDVSAELTLMCQASLEPYRAPLARRSLLGVIESEAETERLPSNVDPVLADPESKSRGRLALATLVEDELILALPQVPRNPAVGAVRYSTTGASDEAGQASSGTDDEEGGRKNPFAELKGRFGGA